MPNHVHLVAVPEREDSLAMLFREVHRRYTRYINFREQWKGHLWQERFNSFVMDERYLFHAVRYVEHNPVKAKLVREAVQWPWSSAGPHIVGTDDGVVSVKPMLNRITEWHSYLNGHSEERLIEAIRVHSRTGRPAGGDAFLDRLEAASGRSLKPQKPGRKVEK